MPINLVGIVIILAAIVAFIILGVFFYFIKVWVRALMSGARVPVLSLVGMKLRHVPPLLIVDARIRLIKAGLDLATDPLEAHYLAGGDVINVVNGLIAADKASISLTFQQAAAINLAGRDVQEAVRTSVIPKVIDCPDPQKSQVSMLDAVAKDGIRM
ncbi:MAG: flotillin-like FloA family protein, partial [bacterium]